MTMMTIDELTAQTEKVIQQYHRGIILLQEASFKIHELHADYFAGCKHAKWNSGPYCATMSCPNYIEKNR